MKFVRYIQYLLLDGIILDNRPHLRIEHISATTMIGDQSPLLDDSGSYDQLSSSMIKVSKTSSALLESFSAENMMNLNIAVADNEPTNVQANENDNEDGITLVLALDDFFFKFQISNFLVDTLYSDSYNSSANTNSPQTLNEETIPKTEEIPQEVTLVTKNESQEELEVEKLYLI